MQTNWEVWEVPSRDLRLQVGCLIKSRRYLSYLRGLQEAQLTLASRLGEAEEKIKVLHSGTFHDQGRHS